jgi:transposase
MPARGLEIATRLMPARLRAEARTSGCARAAARMSAIANALEMPERKEAARLAGLSGQALRDAILRYNAEGLDGLYDRPRSGRPRKLDEAQQAELSRIIVEGPDVEAEGVSSHTLADLARITAERWNISYHPASMSRVVRRLGFSRQKARPRHPKTDPAAQAAFKKSPGNAEGNCRYT